MPFAIRRRRMAKWRTDRLGLTVSRCDELPADGAPETRHSSRRVPPEELARVRHAIYEQ